MITLRVEGLVAEYGLLQAVREVTFSIAEGETVALIGANGAGKSTLLRTIAGAHPAARGTVIFEGNDITDVPAHRRVQTGIALVPEGRKLFPELTVEENLRVAGRRGRRGAWNLDTVIDAFPMLDPLRQQRANTLSGGQQQAASIARALMTNPRLLLVDEVSLGLSPIAVEAVYESLSTLISSGATVVLVEQSLSRAMEVSDKLICLLEGRVVLEAPSSEANREDVTAAYFGAKSSGFESSGPTSSGPAPPGSERTSAIPNTEERH